MFNYYDNEALRKLVIAFGSLFNEVYITRSNSSNVETQRLRVPLTYGSKEKFIRKLDEQSGISDKTKVEITLPRLSFEMGSIDYDPSRHLNKLNKRITRVPGTNSSVSFQEVPYNVSFSLFAFTRTMDDNLQILEQIVPHFTPEFIVSLNLNLIDTKLDVPIVLSNVALQEQYEGNFLDRRIIASSFNFVCKSRLYSEIKEQPIVLASSIEMRNILGDTYTNNELNTTIGATGNTGATGGFTAGAWYES
tara:strand:- start:156 stop:902 length:747 start_codon:yes stop_codon:yes gene_type:complete